MHRSSRLFVFALLIASTSVHAGPLRDLMARWRGAAPLPAGVSVVRDIAYGAAAAQRFDVYLPAGAANAPVIFMVHGGGWRTGDKAAGPVVDNKVARWASRGFIVVSTNYRMLPEADVATEAADVVKALAAAQERATSWGGDRNKFILMGHSAGAHLVALIASTPALAGGTTWLGTVALDSAAMDVELLMQERHLPLYDPVFGADPAYWTRVSPYAQMRARGRPLLAVCSTRRSDSCPQADRFAAKGISLGTRVSVLREDLTHGEIDANLGIDSAYTRAVDDFLRGLLKPQ